jgi:hypothetical protein
VWLRRVAVPGPSNMAEYVQPFDSGGSAVWALIASRVAPAEHEEVRRAIGEQLIKRNEELATEVAALSSVVEEFRQQNDEYAAERIRQAYQKRQVLISGGTERQLLEEQIRLLLNECGGGGGGGGGSGGSGGSASFPGSTGSSSGSGNSGSRNSSTTIECSVRYVPAPPGTLSGELDDEKVLGYIAGGPAAAVEALSSRPHSPHANKDGRRSGRGSGGHSDGRRGGLGGGGTSSLSSMSTAHKSSLSPPLEAIDELSRQLNAFEIESIVGRLRDLFRAERTSLMGRVAALMSSFENEDAGRSHIEASARHAEAVPSTTELREYSSKLQRIAMATPLCDPATLPDTRSRATFCCGGAPLGYSSSSFSFSSSPFSSTRSSHAKPSPLRSSRRLSPGPSFLLAPGARLALPLGSENGTADPRSSLPSSSPPPPSLSSTSTSISRTEFGQRNASCSAGLTLNMTLKERFRARVKESSLESRHLSGDANFIL